MTMRRSARFLLPIILLCSAVALPACSSEADRGTEAVSTLGELSMPLVTTTNGHTYRLSGGFYVSGPTSQLFAMGDENELHVPLPPGTYFANLYNYTLARLDENGTYQPVQAQLTSNFQNFTIYNNTTTTLSWDFTTDGVIIRVGNGNLDVNVDVTETRPVCTVFGTDCPDGTWCPPADLTGLPLACVSAGTVDLGEPCAGPRSCAANASCYDFGGGPRCAALCAPELFGLACPSGGTCTQDGETYGVCTPTSGGGEGGASGEGG